MHIRKFVPLAMAVVAPRAVLLFFNQNCFGDAASRTELAIAWANSPRWLSSFSNGAYQFGPLHLYLVGLAYKAWPHKEDVGRLVSFVFGCLTALPLGLLTRRAFGERAAVVAVVAFAAWGFHWQVSTTAASEALSLFLMISAAEALAAALDGGPGALWHGVRSAIFLNLACATRYDAWLLVPLMAAAVLFGRPEAGGGFSRWRRWGLAAGFGAVGAVFPLCWMASNAHLEGDPLKPLHYIEAFHRAWISSEVSIWGPSTFRVISALFWPGFAALTEGPPVFALGALGMVWAARNRREVRWLIALCLVPAACFTFRSAVLVNFVPLGRFAAGQAILLFPFVEPGWRVIARAWIPRKKVLWAGVLGGLVAIWPLALAAMAAFGEDGVAHSLRPVSPVSRNPPWVQAVVGFLREKVLPDRGSIAVDVDREYDDLQIAFYSGLPEERIARFRAHDFEAKVARLAPRYWVVIEGGRLEAWMRGHRLRASPLPGFPPPCRVLSVDGP